MPYSGKDDPDLPSNVKDLSDSKREKWVATWNSVFNDCMDDDGKKDDCESKAFSITNGTIEDARRSVMTIIQRIIKRLSDLVSNMKRKIKEVDSWDGSASNYDSTEAYCNACLINVNTSDSPEDWSKGMCKLPVREAGDSKSTYVDKACHAAAAALAGSRGGLTKPDGVEDDDWNAAVKAAANELLGAYDDMGEDAPDSLYEAAGKAAPKEEQRSMGMSDFFYGVYDLGMETDDYAWFMDIFVEDDLSMFAIFARNGKLYKTPISMNNGEIALGEWTEVEMAFLPVEAALRRTFVKRQADGRYRWFSISATAVLNRNAEIDSRALFDSFIAHATETGEYPIRQFFHAGEVFKTGQADFMGRDEYLLITSGLYDETELAEREIKARQDNPDYWGDSICFLPSAVEIMEVEGVQIPVYIEGVCREISTLPEDMAGAWFTATPTLKEVTRMLETTQFDAFVKLFDGDEAAAKKWLEEHAASRNRAIAEAGMITRTNAPAPVVQTTEPPALEPAPVVPDDNPVEPVPAIELDEAAVTAIVRAIEGGDAFTTLNTAVTGLAASITGLQTALETANTERAAEMAALNDRIATLERTDAEKRQAWQQDLPPAMKTPKTQITFRPRAVEPVAGNGKLEPVDVSEILDALPKY